MGENWPKLVGLVLATGVTLFCVWLMSDQTLNARVKYMLHPDPPCQAPAGQICVKM